MAHRLAGKPAPRYLLANIPRLVSAYFTRRPDPDDPSQRVAFGTSGHRGSSLNNAFNEPHILAICQAIVEFRGSRRIHGPLFIGMDTHALSEPAMATALEVFAAAGIQVVLQKELGFTPTPVISHAIVTHNRGRLRNLADGVVITPSHNPPEDGGFKYNPPHGGPADSETTRTIESRANELLSHGLDHVRRIPYEKALRADTTRQHDLITPYVEDLENVLDMAGIHEAGIKIGVDPLGGSSIQLWGAIAERYGLSIDVVNPGVDPTFGFMTVDKDGKIRMDCSSPYAMARLVRLRNRFDIAVATDPDADRHGVVTSGAGLLNPNHFLAAAAWYLFRNRPGWNRKAAVGKTLVSSSMIDRVAEHLGRALYEVPVGFKWFVGGLIDGACGFCGEESAGATFLRKDGRVWTTDKDGIIMDLLACEMLAKTGEDPGRIYQKLAGLLGDPAYERIDAPADAGRKEVLRMLRPDMITAEELAGEPVLRIHTRAPGNNEPIGGLKVVAQNGWFAARPSGTEDVYKIYAESYKGKKHLRRIQKEALEMVEAAFARAGV